MKKVPWRAGIYLLVVLYLLIDLSWCRGPLKRSIESREKDLVKVAIEQGHVATINQEPLTRSQLDLAVFRHLYQRGKKPEDLPPANLKMVRRAVLQQLIDDTLVRQYADGENYQASPQEIEPYVEAWKLQFGKDEELAERCRAMGTTVEEVEKELSRIWSRKKWLEQRIEPGVAVTEEEVRDWYEIHRAGGGEGFLEPEKLRARHIFVSTVETDDDTKEELIREAWTKLTEEKLSFAKVAAEYSDDPRTKDHGGDLNWFSRDRVPEDFSSRVFSLEKGKLSEPFRTSIGWHVVEVLDHQPEREVTYEEARGQIERHLRNTRRADTIQLLMKKLRTVARIRVFPENL